MKTFGTRNTHIELDPWAKRETSQKDVPRSIAKARLKAYVASAAALGIIAVATFQYLAMA